MNAWRGWFTWLAGWGARRKRAQFRRGYEWGASVLLMGTMTASALENQTGVAMTLDGDHSFERGARKALNDWTRLPERYEGAWKP